MSAPLVAVADRHSAPWWQLALSVTVALLGFFAPFSTAGVALCEVMLLALACVRPRTLLHARPWREPVMAMGLLLFAYIAVHSVVTSGWTMASLHATNSYQELVLAPLAFSLLARRDDRKLFLRGLVTGAVVTALVHWCARLDRHWYELMEVRRISAGFALSICAYLLMLRSRGSARPWRLRALAGFLALSVLFAMGGRTGYLALLLLAAVAAWTHTSRRWRWTAAIATPLIVVAVALGSSAVSSRIHETLAGAQPPGPHGEYNSTTIRIHLLQVGGDLARRYWPAGAGFANYAAAHAEAARERFHVSVAEGDPRARWMLSDNPHNEYIFELVGGGLPAVALFVAWLALAVRAGVRTSSPAGPMLLGTALAFALGCMFNSLLRDFVEGHLYAALLACLLAETRDASPAERPIRRVLVVCTRQIGDVLLTTPLLHSARRCWPEARIDVLAFAGTAGMLRGNPDVHTLLEFPARLGWRGMRSLVRRLWRSYDLALIADPGDRAHLIGWVAAPLRSGIVPRRGGSNWLKRAALEHQVISAGDLGGVHVTVEKLALLAPWVPAPGRPQVVAPPAAPLPPQAAEAVQPGAIVVHAPSMWPYKQWPIGHFRQLVSALLAQGRQVVLTGSGSARDRECVAALRALASPPALLDLSGQLDFNQLVGLLQRAALYIGPDTSVSHLAAATGIPVIAIFGPTNPMRWAPWPAAPQTQALFARSAAVQQAGNVTVLQGPQSCVPCGRAGCEDDRASRSDCLPAITPQQVLAQAERLLSRG